MRTQTSPRISRRRSSCLMAFCWHFPDRYCRRNALQLFYVLMLALQADGLAFRCYRRICVSLLSEVVWLCGEDSERRIMRLLVWIPVMAVSFCSLLSLRVVGLLASALEKMKNWGLMRVLQICVFWSTQGSPPPPPPQKKKKKKGKSIGGQKSEQIYTTD